MGKILGRYAEPVGIIRHGAMSGMVLRHFGYESFVQSAAPPADGIPGLPFRQGPDNLPGIAAQDLHVTGDHIALIPVIPVGYLLFHRDVHHGSEIQNWDGKTKKSGLNGRFVLVAGGGLEPPTSGL